MANLRQPTKWLPAQNYRAPGESAAHRFKQQYVAPLDAAVTRRLGESQGNGRRRRVAVVVNRTHDLLQRNAKLLGTCLDDADVGLVRHEPVDVRCGEPGRG